jgi:cytochrome c oxidase subunit 1
MNELLGKLHVWPSLIAMNFIFMPMFIQGLAGVSRRLYDGGASYQFAESVVGLNRMMSYSAWLLGLAQIPFVINFFWSMRRGEPVEENPWQATTLEWAAPSPPPHGNFVTAPVAYRGPYEYSVPGGARDFAPQHQPTEA